MKYFPIKGFKSMSIERLGCVWGKYKILGNQELQALCLRSSKFKIIPTYGYKIQQWVMFVTEIRIKANLRGK